MVHRNYSSLLACGDCTIEYIWNSKGIPKDEDNEVQMLGVFYLQKNKQQKDFRWRRFVISYRCFILLSKPRIYLQLHSNMAGYTIPNPPI
jgi:hypothetical protein